ncbi:zinc-dependent alcohol dehydrogenase [Desulfofalx alkaliphila]|uniref:zinc-dependent alcohol dehydrogenase n=1 Tax=Desulfofalx alkaliphila TaxID=105483 RepID=UPI000A798CEA|nr:alcohol dehydrogenase catalytic domain-containing protein [Desulfofalx alkaliphila]
MSNIINDKMKAVVYQGKEQISIQEVAIPELTEGEVLIKVHYAGICGSDLSIYSGKHPRAKAPLIMGHEFTGEVVKTCLPDGAKIKVGDRVTVYPLISCGRCQPCLTGNGHVCRSLKLVGIDCDGGFAEYVKVDADKVFKIPDNMAMDVACLIEPLAVAVHAVRKSTLKAGDTAVVIGGGPIGLLTAMTARYAGASNVIICEVSPTRIKLAKELGFTVLNSANNPLEEVMALTDNNGADVVFEAAGAAPTALLATQLVKITGEIVVVGVFKEATPVDLQAVNFRELKMIGVRVYTPKDYQVALEMLRNDESIAKVISHRIKFNEAQRAIDLMIQAENSMKLLLHP